MLCVATLASLAACASVWTPIQTIDGDRILHRKLGFSLLRPDALVEPSQEEPSNDLAGPWQQTRVDGAALAYRRADGTRMSLLTECGRGVTRPQVRARQLLFGIDERGEVDGFAIDLQGLPGWVQRVIASQGSGAVDLKTVTLLDGVCTLDWVLVQPNAARPAEALFDRWWRSYRRPRPGEAGAGAGGAGGENAPPAVVPVASLASLATRRDA